MCYAMSMCIWTLRRPFVLCIWPASQCRDPVQKVVRVGAAGRIGRGIVKIQYMFLFCVLNLYTYTLHGHMTCTRTYVYSAVFSLFGLCTVHVLIVLPRARSCNTLVYRTYDYFGKLLQRIPRFPFPLGVLQCAACQ